MHKLLHVTPMGFIYTHSHWLSCIISPKDVADSRPSWRIWTDLRDLVSTFDTDDVMQRFIILFTLTCLLGFTVNMTGGLEGTLTMIVPSKERFQLTFRLHFTLLPDYF